MQAGRNARSVRGAVSWGLFSVIILLGVQHVWVSVLADSLRHFSLIHGRRGRGVTDDMAVNVMPRHRAESSGRQCR